MKKITIDSHFNTGTDTAHFFENFVLFYLPFAAQFVVDVKKKAVL